MLSMLRAPSREVVAKAEVALRLGLSRSGSLDADAVLARSLSLGGDDAAAAIEAAHEAARLDPSWAAPHARLAVLHWERRAYAEGADEGWKALALNEHDPFTMGVLAKCLRAGGLSVEAEEWETTLRELYRPLE